MRTMLPKSCTGNPKIRQRFETLRKIEAAEQKAQMDSWLALSNGQLFPPPDQIQNCVCQYYLNLVEDNDTKARLGLPTVNLVESDFKKLRSTKRKVLMTKIIKMKSLKEGKPVNSLNLGVSQEEAQSFFNSRKAILDQIEAVTMLGESGTEFADAWSCYSPGYASRVDRFLSQDKINNNIKSFCLKNVISGGLSKSQKNFMKKTDGDVKNLARPVSTPKAGSLMSSKKTRFTLPV